MHCKKCNQEKSKCFFSKSQQKNKADNKKCLECTERVDSVVNVEYSKNKSLNLEKQIVLFSKLTKWLKQNGSYFPGLEIKHFNENFLIVINYINLSFYLNLIHI